MSMYTDIAMECVNSTFKKKESLLDYGCKESIVNIVTTKMQREFNKPKGEYYLLDCPNLNMLAPVVYDYIVEQVASYLKYKIKKITNKERVKVLVVCLGNENLVSDSLGAQVFDKLITTKDEKEESNILQAIKTSVFGKTGINTADLTKSMVSISCPDVVILIDSLCSQSVSRIGNSLQISDSGIVAGGAIGKDGKRINANLLRTPTLAMGIPYVVRVETIIGEILGNLTEDRDFEDDKTIYNKIKSLFVTPKEIDLMVDLGAYIIASAINLAVLDLGIDEQRLIKL